MKEFRLQRDGAESLIFRGDVVSSDTVRLDGGGVRMDAVYRSETGEMIEQVIEHAVPGRPDRQQARIVGAVDSGRGSASARATGRIT
jgi:hypothetical protein